MFEEWSVVEDPKTQKHPGAWVLELVLTEWPPVIRGESSRDRYIDVGPLTLTWEQAIDSALEFMDRLRTGAVPKTIDDPRELMSMCVRNTRRQN